MTSVVLLARDLLIASRIEGWLLPASASLRRVDDIDQLPAAASVDVLLVDWDARHDDWGDRLRSWRAGDLRREGARIVLFGPHTDLEAHAAARRARLGPMRARSWLRAGLPALMAESKAAIQR